MFQIVNFFTKQPDSTSGLSNRTSKKRMQVLALLGASTFMLSACTDSELGSVEPFRTGVFQDASVVEGLRFETDTVSGTTNSDGEFTFTAGEFITFSIGDVELPQVQAANDISPLTVFGSSEVSDTRVVNLSRLLQSLDTDANTVNGITLPEATRLENAFSAGSVDFAAADFDQQAANVLSILNSTASVAPIDTTEPAEITESTETNEPTESVEIVEPVQPVEAVLVDEQTASAELTETLIENELISAGCSADHRYVGRSRELSTFSHGVSGTVTVLDDCTLEVTNFNYDGFGPSVFFYAAVAGNYANPAGILGPQINGQAWVNDTLRLPLPDGVTLDDFDSLSVWCRDFNANFGDVFIGDQ